MGQTEMDGLVSFSLSAENRPVTKEQSLLRSALSSASCQRSGRSPALPYPLHECLKSIMFFSPPWQRGHLYFVNQGTSLFWVDRKNLTLLAQSSRVPFYQS